MNARQENENCDSGLQWKLPLVSLAAHFGSKAAGVQLTGMGDDGAQGLLELKQAGGRTLIQDEASSMIYGMPKAAKLLGAAQHELTPRAIAADLSQMASRPPLRTL